MNGMLYAALVVAILVFAWSFVRVATLADGRSRGRAEDEWYVVDASESALRRAGHWQERPTIAGVPMVPRVIGMSSCGSPKVGFVVPNGGSDSGATYAGDTWRAPHNPDRPIVWVLSGRSAEPGLLQEELARLKRVGAIRNYYRVVAYPEGSVDYRA